MELRRDARSPTPTAPEFRTRNTGLKVGEKDPSEVYRYLKVNHLKKIYLARSMIRFRTIFLAFKKNQFQMLEII